MGQFDVRGMIGIIPVISPLAHRGIVANAIRRLDGPSVLVAFTRGLILTDWLRLSHDCGLWIRRVVQQLAYQVRQLLGMLASHHYSDDFDALRGSNDFLEQ